MDPNTRRTGMDTGCPNVIVIVDPCSRMIIMNTGCPNKSENVIVNPYSRIIIMYTGCTKTIFSFKFNKDPKIRIPRKATGCLKH